MLIKKILEKINYIDFIGDAELDVDDITYTSLKVKKGTIFVAIRGFKQDGHQYIDSARENGCEVILCEEILHPIEGLSYIVVDDTRVSMTDISYLIKKPDTGIKLLGVTGTNGKTSITYLLKSIYDYSHLNSGIIGTIGAVIGNTRTPLNNTTPESTDLHDIINEMKTKDIGTCFMEVSSHSTELHRVRNLHYESGIFTNLTEDHLIFHKTMENYYLAKKKFFYQCRQCIINIDDEYGYRMYNELKLEGKDVISYSSKHESDYYIDKMEISIEGSKFRLTTKEQQYYIFIKTPGIFNIYNYVSAMIAASFQNIPIEECIAALESIDGVEGRFEFVPTSLDCTVILDFAHTPDGLEKVMETINQFATGRKVVLFGAGGERDKARRTLMGEVAGRYCDFVMLTADNPLGEDPVEICLEIAKGVEKYHHHHMTIIDREKAIQYLIENYESNDVILLAGKSTEPYQAVGNRKIPYNEKAIAIRAIREKEITTGKAEK